MYVTTDTFDRQIQFLKKKFEVVHLEELLSNVLSGRQIGRHCAITFDDGWLDNYTQAFPILTKYQIPATIFLSTGLIGTNRLFWPEEFSLLHSKNGI